MTDAQAFIHERPHLVWYVKDVAALDDASVVEHVLNYGDWSDVQALLRVMGLGVVANLFRAAVAKQRHNYRKNIAHYFTLYFNQHAAR